MVSLGSTPNLLNTATSRRSSLHLTQPTAAAAAGRRTLFNQVLFRPPCPSASLHSNPHRRAGCADSRWNSRSLWDIPLHRLGSTSITLSRWHPRLSWTPPPSRVRTVTRPPCPIWTCSKRTAISGHRSVLNNQKYVSNDYRRWHNTQQEQHSEQTLNGINHFTFVIPYTQCLTLTILPCKAKRQCLLTFRFARQ